MLFGKNKSVDAEEFWKNREEELGISVLGKTLGRVIRDDRAYPIWGLFYLTAKAVYFQTFESENWLSLLFTGGKGSGRTKNETVEIPAEDIVRFQTAPGKKGFLKRLRQPTLIDLAWNSKETGIEENLLIEMDGDAEGFVAAFSR